MLKAIKNFIASLDDGDLPQQLVRAINTNNNTRVQGIINQIQSLPPEQKQAVLDHKDIIGQTPLIVAVASKNIHAASYLITAGANVNIMSRGGSPSGSPIMFAVNNGQFELVRQLLHHGANPFIENIVGTTALDMAKKRKDERMIRLIEGRAIYRGWLVVNVRKLIRTALEHRWCVITIRYPCPHLPMAQQHRRTHMSLYDNGQQTQPSTELWLDGCSLVVNHNNQHRIEDMTLNLHATHPKPLGSILVTKSKSTGRQMISFRPCSQADDAQQYARHMVNLIQAGAPVGYSAIPEPPRHSQTMPTTSPTPATTVPHSTSLPSPGPAQTPSSRPSDTLAQLTANPNESDEDFAKRIQAQLDQSAPSCQPPIAPGLTACQQAAQQSSCQTSMETSPAPSAPPLPSERIPVPNNFGGILEEEEEKAGTCVICMDRVARFGFVHADSDSMHVGVCQQCKDENYSELVKECPICRSPVERLLQIFNT